jgi:hypothetical protein
MSDSWLHELSGLIGAAASMSVGPNLEIRFRCGDAVYGIDLASGSVSGGERAASELCGDEEIMNSLVRGEVTLQAAFRSGRVVLTGDPEPFLRLAIVLDRARAADALPC